MVAHILTADPIPHGIKGNHKCSNKAANILTAAPPPPPIDPGGQKDKAQLFQNMVMLHTKLKGITNAATL